MFAKSVHFNCVKKTHFILSKRTIKIPLWEFLKNSFQARANPEASYHRKRIGGFQPIKIELLPNRTYYWCTCGYAHNQAFCDQACRNLRGDFRPLKFTSSKYQMADICMCKSTSNEPFCDQSCRTRFSGMQTRMGNAVEGTFSNMKEFLNTVPRGLENYRQYAAERQATLESTERIKKKIDDEQNKKMNKKK